VKKLDFGKVKVALSSAGWQQTFFHVMLEQYQQEVEENALAQCEADYLIGWERLSGVLSHEQMEQLEELERHCEDETLIALRIALERGVFAGFQDFFRADVEPLTFEHFVEDKLLTVPQMMQFPDYYEARMKVNELETELADQLDPFSREHLTSITYAWEERTMAMLRYGFALGYQEALEVIGQVEPKRQTQMAGSVLPSSREAGMILPFKPKQ
jgi:hypothetical protein